MVLMLRDALEMGLKSKFRTIENAREMLETGEEPLTMNISSEPFNIAQETSDQSARHMRIGSLALRNVEFD